MPSFFIDKIPLKSHINFYFLFLEEKEKQAKRAQMPKFQRLRACSKNKKSTAKHYNQNFVGATIKKETIEIPIVSFVL